MKDRLENIEQRLRNVGGALRLRAGLGVERIVSTDWQREKPREDVLRLRRGRGG